MVKKENKESYEKYLKGLNAFLSSKRATTAREISSLRMTDPTLAEALLPALLSLLKDDEKSVRSAACESIVELLVSLNQLIPNAIENLLKFTDDNSQETRRETYLLLIKLGEKDKNAFRIALPQLLPLVESDNQEKRLAIITVLDKVGFAGKEYSYEISNMTQILEKSSLSGFDIEKAKKYFALAKEEMKKGNVPEFRRNISDAKNYAKKSVFVEEIWRVNLDSKPKTSAVSSDGDICVLGDSSGNIFCYDSNGKMLWTEKCLGAVNEVGIFSLGRFIVATSDDKYVRLFERDGKLIWKYYAGEATHALSISANGKKIFVAGASNVVYVFDREGNLLEKIVVSEGCPLKLVQSTDGRFFAMSCGDYHVYLLNNVFHVVWKKIVGRCKDVALSGLGDKLVVGEKGNFLNCFDNSGKLIWKFEGNDQFQHVASNLDGSRFFASSRKTLYSLDENGKLIWRFATDSEITDLSISPHGYYLVISTVTGLTFLHNYEAYRQALARFESNLCAVAAMGVDTSKAVSLYSEASKAFKICEYKKGAKLSIEAEARLRAEKLLKTIEAIKKAKEIMETSARDGLDVSRCRELLLDAVSALSDERYNEALAKAAESLESVKGAKKVKEWDKFIDDLISDL